MSISLLCFVAAFALAVYALIDARGRGILNWAVALVTLGLLYPYLPRS